jgi:hypothetical protein
MMPPGTNRRAASAAATMGRGVSGGSDAHTLASVARTYTVVPGARTADEFLQGLREGRCIAEGREGGYLRLTADVARVMAAAYLQALVGPASGRRERARLLALAALLPVVPLLPVVTAVHTAREWSFTRRLYDRWRARCASPLVLWHPPASEARL